MTERVEPPEQLDDVLEARTRDARLDAVRSRGLDNESGLAAILDRVEELVHDDPAAASDLAQVCDMVAVPLGLHAISARSQYLRARVEAERGELETALSLIEGARTLWWRTGDRWSALRTDLGRTHVLDDLGRHAEAAAVAESLIAAVDSLDDEGDPDRRLWLKAAGLENLGVAAGFTGDHERALEAYAAAETVYRKVGTEADTARPLGNRGIELLGLGRPREALELLRAAAALFADDGDRLWWAKCSGHVAEAHQQLGEHFEALRVFEAARVTLDELGAGAEAVRLQIAVAGAYLAIGLYDEAHAEATAAAERTEAAGMAHDAATARFRVALAHMGTGALDRAADELAVAARMLEDVGDRHLRARVRLAQAEVAGRQGRFDEAIELAGVAIEELAGGGWPVGLAWAELRLADLEDREGDEAAAEGHVERATSIADELRLPQLQYHCGLRRARLRRRQGRTDEAEQLLREAIDQVESVSVNLPDHALRTAFRAERLEAHDELVALLIERGTPSAVGEAWRVSNRAKAQTLVDLVSATIGARVRAPGDSGADRELDQLLVDLNAVYGELLTADDPPRRVLLRQRADELESQASTVRLRRAAMTQRAGTAPDVRAPSPDVPSMPASVPTLAYHVAGDDLIVFVVHGDNVTAQRAFGVVPQIDAQLDRLASQWSRFQLGTAFPRRHQPTLLATVREVLAALHRLLIAPVVPLLTSADSEHLVVVPHRRLHEVPFHALYDGSAYLVDNWAVAVAPTLAGGKGVAPTPIAPARRALVLAVADSQAPSVEAEAAALAALLPAADVLVGDDATLEALAAHAPGAGVVHLACHCLYRPANPLFSALRLGDRWVTAAEILELGQDLGGALVTLSSCESGRSGRGAAEPAGLAWAFLAAGASGAVVSQWVVHDEAAVGLMSEFYRQVVEGRDPAQALRHAQRATAEDHPHPYYWAPFSYVMAPPDAG